MSTRLELEGMKNTRDLGGMKTMDGRVIRSGKLLRSGHMGSATQADIQALRAIPLAKIYDFRTPVEREENEDISIDGVEYIHLPLVEEEKLGMTREQMTDATVFRMLMEDPNFYLGYMSEVYTEIVNGELTQQRIGGFLRALAEDESDGATLWHCTAGKDRAGMTAVYLQTLLGVSREDIYADYLQTNLYVSDEIDRAVQMVKRMSGFDIPRNIIAMFIGADERFLDAAYQAAEQMSGSMEAYIREKLGVDDETRAKLQAKYLQ